MRLASAGEVQGHQLRPNYPDYLPVRMARKQNKKEWQWTRWNGKAADARRGAGCGKTLRVLAVDDPGLVTSHACLPLNTNGTTNFTSVES